MLMCRLVEEMVMSPSADFDPTTVCMAMCRHLEETAMSPPANFDL
jgi:hypothetical protein